MSNRPRRTAMGLALRQGLGMRVGIGHPGRAAMKERTTATNRWLGEALNMGGLDEVSRQVSAWHRQSDDPQRRKLAGAPNYNA